MVWHEITIVTKEDAQEMISHFLHEMGAGGVSIEESSHASKMRHTSLGVWYGEEPLNHIAEGDAEIKGYFADHRNPSALVKELEQHIMALKDLDIDVGEAKLSCKEVLESDWADGWKQYFKPTHITDDIVIKPRWETYEKQHNEIIIELDPGMAFGTGTHATTALSMKCLQQIITTGDHIIDVGTGSGILAIGAAKMGAGQVLAVDLDPVAVKSAKENVAMNELEKQIHVQESDLLNVLQLHDEGAIPVSLPVPIVVANILAEVILQFVDDVYKVLKPGGKYVVSGIIEPKEQEVVKALEKAGFTVMTRLQEEDWIALIAEKQ
ncbi:50S ribosomal protein L11 methyltransferase [Longirhabdus pacifica]|uniref:50S ribosomal protein L11 methyltransferase n=1 Tax=Longirhabdus pacifica TaxID=2305227 RepID=UPI001008697F|nr:50S ribosomal protein L11 methyltransferase [Longirhabdus pacifica]